MKKGDNKQQTCSSCTYLEFTAWVLRFRKFPYFFSIWSWGFTVITIRKVT